MAIRDFRDLHVWQKSMDFVESVYRHTASFPDDERFGLSSQLRRAAVSIPSNIAEGQGRGSDKEFLRFLNIARGSRNEAVTQILLANRLNYLDEKQKSELQALADEVGRLINGLAKRLSANNQV